MATLYWDTNGSGNGLVGGNGIWSTSVANWNLNSDGSGSNVVWTNSTSNEANFQGGGGTITLGGNITADLIYGSPSINNVTLNGVYSINLSSVVNCNLTANVPVTSTIDTVYGFQQFFGSLTLNNGFYCNAFRLGVTTIIGNTFTVTSTTIGNVLDTSLTLNGDSNINGVTNINSGGSLTVGSNNTSSFNNKIYTYGDITSNGLLQLNDGLYVYQPLTLGGSGVCNINGNLDTIYNLTKTGTGTIFLSGSITDFAYKTITVSQGTFKTNSDANYSNTDIICSGTLSCMGNFTVSGNLLFATGTIRLGI